MLIFSKPTVYLSLLLALIAVPLSHAEPYNELKIKEFSDPGYVANMQKGFLEKAIKYDEKVGKDVEVVISLGQQTYPALHEIIEKMAKDQGIKIEIQQGTCGATAKKLLKKSVDIATYCCPPGKTDRLPGLKFNTVAIAAVALVTHKNNPISNVSTEDARKIFRGEYVSWSEVPGYQSVTDKLMGKRIQPVVRLHCKKRPGHWRLLFGSQDEISPRAQSVGTITDMIAQVASNDSSIGFETPYMLKVHKDKGDLKTLSIDGIKPGNSEKLLNGEYPIYRTYNLTTWVNKNNRNVKAEILMDDIYDYIQNNYEQYGFVPASALKSAGWKFKDRELIAVPDGYNIISEHE